MPSLQALGEFKASLFNIGGEPQALRELELPRDDLPLPDAEPAAGRDPGGPAARTQGDAEKPLDAFPGTASPGTEPLAGTGEDARGTDFINFGDLGDLLGGMNAPEAGNNGDTPPAGQGDIEFGNFIDSIPDDFSSGEAAADREIPGDDLAPVGGDDFEIPNEDLAPVGTSDGLDLDELTPVGDDSSPGNAEPEQNDFDLPAGLLDGFADEIEAERNSSGNDELPPDTGTTGAGDNDIGDLDFGDLDFGNQDAGNEGSPGQDLSGDDLSGDDLSGEDLGDFPDFDSNEKADSAGMDLAGEEPLNLGSLDLGSLDIGPLESPEAGTGTPAAPGAAASADASAAAPVEAEPSGEEDSFDLGGESFDFDTSAVLEEIPSDTFDEFKLDTGAPAEDFNLDGVSDSFGDDFGGHDDFSLPGIDSVFDGKSPPIPAAAPKAAGTTPAEGPAVEEINLTDKELNQFEKTLSSYPLNLRIACEELIAEQAVDPGQMSLLVKLLVNGAPAGETAELAGKLLGRNISIPKGFEKKTGEALEAEQSSFAYIFIHNFLPVLRLFMIIALALLSLGYLGWRFIYTPLKAENIYKLGFERIAAGEYGRANERFREAYAIQPKKPWFYKYARAFRDARQYTLAEEKYQELLYYTASKNKRHIPEKAAVLEFAGMETNTIGNYQKADELLRHNILDYSPRDQDALLALGDNNLGWGEYEPSRLENARQAYATLIERYGRSDPLLERMLKYFIRIDNLEEVLPLQSYFMASPKRKISAAALAELGGYLLDKRFEKVQGVPNAYLDEISGIRDVLLRAIRQDSMLPESYYHLARYYYYFENFKDEKTTLEIAVKVFEAVKEENSKRITYHINTLLRYGEVLIDTREFFTAEENLVKGINLYQDGLSRRLLKRSPEFGKLYADLGDLEYFTKDDDMESALDYYNSAVQNGWAPPEIQYRMGAAFYQLRQWESAQDHLLAAYREMAPNRRILYALGNVSHMRGNYFAAQGYYNRLLEMLEADRARLPGIMPTNDAKQQDLVERLMIVRNNLAVTLEALTERTGSNKYRLRAQSLYSDSAQAWDIFTRNPATMIRMRPSPDIAGPGVNPAYLNIQNDLNPVPGYQPLLFLRIDKDVLEPSAWEVLAPPGYRLSEGISTNR